MTPYIGTHKQNFKGESSAMFRILSKVVMYVICQAVCMLIG